MDRRSIMRAALTPKEVVPGADGYFWLYLDVDDISEPTKILNITNKVTDVIVDGVSIVPATTYQFSSTGEHLVKVLATQLTYAYGQGNFAGITTLKTVYAPSTFTSSSRGLFYGCTNLEDVVWSNLYGIDNGTFQLCSSLWLTGVTLTGVTSLNLSAFEQCGLTSIVIQGTVTGTGERVFYQCPNLASVTLPFSLTTIAKNAFCGCSNLTSINLGNVTTFGNTAFQNCTSLTSVDVSGATSFGLYAFEGCTSLTTVDLSHFSGTFGQGVFRYCPLTSISTLATTIPTRCFSETDASTIYLPNVTTIDNYAFAEGRNAYIDIGANCTSIGNNAIYTATAKYTPNRTVVCRATTPPTLGNSNFRCMVTGQGFVYDTDIYVPYSADHSILDAYKAANNWSTFASRMYELDQNGNIPT